jgi:hypothetical protein
MSVLHALLHWAGDGFEDTIEPDAISNLITVAGNILWLDIQDPTPDDVELFSLASTT